MKSNDHSEGATPLTTNGDHYENIKNLARKRAQLKPDDQNKGRKFMNLIIDYREQTNL